MKKILRAISFRIVDALSLLTQVLSNRKKEIPDNINTILVVDIALLGDLLMATPFLAGLRECFPYARITLLCTPQAAEAVKYNPKIDSIHLYEAFWEERGRSYGPRLRHLRSTLRLAIFYMRNRFDVAFMLNVRQQPFVSLIGYLSRARIRVGIRYPLGHRFLTHTIEDTKDHYAIARLKLLSILCKRNVGTIAYEYGVTDESYEYARDVVKKMFGAIDFPFVCITPSTLQKSKRWRIDTWISLINKLNDNKYGVVLGGGKSDAAYIDQIFAGIVNHKMSYHLAGNLNLNKFAGLMLLSKCLVTVDSAPVHLAAALKVPSVALFSQVYDYNRITPENSTSQILIREVPCAQCLKGCDANMCMDFGVDEVFSAVIALIPELNPRLRRGE